MTRLAISFSAFAVAMASLSPALAHVSLQEPQAETGATYTAVFRVGHGCDTSSTTSVTARLPAGFDKVQPVPKPGWNVQVEGGKVTWKAGTKDAALPNGQRGEFALTGTLPRVPGPLWFKVLQTCEQGGIDWADLPAQGLSTAGMKTPAVLLEVMSARDLAAARARPKVDAAWVRGSVAGQQGTGAFMRLTATEPMQLVGVSTPVAATAQVHQMKMEGDVMLMRPVDKLDLPAGQAVELKPGGYHIMLLDLKQTLTPGSTVPLTLQLRNAQGVTSKVELQLPVAMQAPGSAAGASAPTGGHKH